MPELSILVPVYNEERTLPNIMEEITAACPEAQIIYIDDGSYDKSYEILKEKARVNDLVLTQRNGGKGSAIRYGLTRATGIYTIIQDADLEYDPKQITELMNIARKYPHDAVFGSRFLQKNPNVYRLYLLGNKALTMILNLLFRSRLTDAYTCYKLFPTMMAKTLPLKANGFELEAELCAWLLAKGITIHEIPISYQPRSFDEGKKIRMQDALKGMITMIEIRWKHKIDSL